MPTIAFIFPQQAYLPDIIAYEKYYSKKGFTILKAASPLHLKDIPYDIEWHIMGIDRLKNISNIFKIHEYASLSTPPFGRVKDFIKGKVNVIPAMRIFLNHEIYNTYKFKDGLPYYFRDMGVDDLFLSYRKISVKKEYDFVYLGSMDKKRQVENFLKFFKDRFTNKKILIIGTPSTYLHSLFSNCDNIIFTGRVNYMEVPALLSLCEYGINYVPDQYPFNLQASTKLLEYCACGLKIITSTYKWANDFEKINNADFFKIDNNFTNFYPDKIEEYTYTTPNMSKYTWDTIIEQSGVPAFLQATFCNPTT
jgi:glycosyltransferase involved in cell wall biosynthesis